MIMKAIETTNHWSFISEVAELVKIWEELLAWVVTEQTDRGRMNSVLSCNAVMLSYKAILGRENLV